MVRFWNSLTDLAETYGFDCSAPEQPAKKIHGDFIMRLPGRDEPSSPLARMHKGGGHRKKLSVGMFCHRSMLLLRILTSSSSQLTPASLVPIATVAWNSSACSATLHRSKLPSQKSKGEYTFFKMAKIQNATSTLLPLSQRHHLNLDQRRSLPEH